MPINKRVVFLDSFLRLFGADRIEWLNVNHNKVLGTVIYVDAERQDFCWYMLEDNVPEENILELIKVINDKGFVNIDRLTISPENLFKETGWTDFNHFISLLNVLLQVEVKMLDNGEETDSYIIHT